MRAALHPPRRRPAGRAGRHVLFLAGLLAAAVPGAAPARAHADGVHRSQLQAHREPAAGRGGMGEAMRQTSAAGAGLQRARVDLPAVRRRSWVALGGAGVAFLLGLLALRSALAARGRRAVHEAAALGRFPAGRIFGRRPTPPPAAPAEHPVLRGIDGEFAGTVIGLGTAPTVMGRDPRVAHLVFPPSATLVSGRHCELRYDAALRQFTLEDLGSTNGTFLDGGGRIAPGAPGRLRPGDRFYVGSRMHVFEVHLSASDGSAA